MVLSLKSKRFLIYTFNANFTNRMTVTADILLRVNYLQLLQAINAAHPRPLTWGKVSTASRRLVRFLARVNKTISLKSHPLQEGLCWLPACKKT